jgi:putative ABC transport system ATP-binding protein
MESNGTSQPIITAKHLGKTYRSGKLEVAALRDASFSIDAGEFVAIVGPSGSGKSTLFYVLGGLTSATSGSLFIQGKDFSRLNDAQRTDLRRSQIGFVFQKFNLLPTISAQTNIELAHDIAQTGKPFDHALLDHLRVAEDQGPARPPAERAFRRRAAAGGHRTRADHAPRHRAGR